jgi:predicted nucleic acid-binding protein
VSRVFVDTSALLALLNPNDTAHKRARAAFDGLAAAGDALVTTSYVLVETYALVARRLGAEAVRAFRESFAPLLEVTWVDEPLHEAGLDLLTARKSRRISLVDAVSFVAIRQRSVDRVFAYDDDFRRERFDLL